MARKKKSSKEGAESTAVALKGAEEILAAIPAELKASFEEVERVAGEYSLAQMSTRGRVERALILSEGVKRLRALVQGEVLNRFLSLQGTRLGFRTDKDSTGGYEPEVVSQCIVEGLLLGVYPVGNQMNIISNQAYITKEGFEQKLEDLDGFTNFEPSYGVPRRNSDQTALVKCTAKWIYHGEEMSIGYGDDLCDIPVIAHKTTNVDAVIGKAERKLMSRVFKRCTGRSIPDGDAGEGEIKSVKVNVTSGPKDPGDSPSVILDVENGTQETKSRTDELLGQLEAERAQEAKSGAQEGEKKTVEAESIPPEPQKEDGAAKISKGLERDAAERKERMKEAEAAQNAQGEAKEGEKGTHAQGTLMKPPEKKGAPEATYSVTCRGDAVKEGGAAWPILTEVGFTAGAMDNEGRPTAFKILKTLPLAQKVAERISLLKSADGALLCETGHLLINVVDLSTGEVVLTTEPE